MGAPGLGTDYPKTVERIADCGLRIVEPPAVGALAEMLQIDRDTRPRIASLVGPAGVGKRVIVGELARIARVNGFVPIAARALASRHAELWRGRNLLVIAPAADEGTWAAFLNAALLQAQPHVLLLVGETECRSVAAIVVRRLTEDALVSAVWPPVAGGPLERLVGRAAERAGGLPGRFARLLWPGWTRRGWGERGIRWDPAAACRGGAGDVRRRRDDRGTLRRAGGAVRVAGAGRARGAAAQDGPGDRRPCARPPRAGDPALARGRRQPRAPGRVERCRTRRAGARAGIAAARPHARRAGDRRRRSRLRHPGRGGNDAARFCGRRRRGVDRSRPRRRGG